MSEWKGYRLYSDDSESEKLALAMAAEAAKRILPNPIYRAHNKENFYTIYKNGKYVHELIKPLPKGAVVLQIMLISFAGNLYNYITVGLKGTAKGKEIDWRASSVCSPLNKSIFSKNEIASLTEKFKKEIGEKEGE